MANEEAARLAEVSDHSRAQDRRPGKMARLLRVRVVEDGHPTVNVKVPIGVAKWGMKMAQAFSPEIKDAKSGLGKHHRHHPGGRAGKDRGGGGRGRPQDR
jgi:hypothetical protein